MFKIFDDADNLIGITDKINFVHFDAANNVFVDARSARSADGFAFNGTVYNFGSEKIAGASFAHFMEVDGGEFVFNLSNELADTNAALDDVIISLLEG